ncbi:PKD domain-containing protein [Rubrivirga sp.]|uniref:PKD domain-containing protein n=1 Tax=Rubrivirga sp. TaxID=1885344 RepID=UPI003C72D3BB
MPRVSSIFLWCAVLLLATAAQAQVVRPSESIYILLRGGATGYYGDLDGNSDDDPDQATPDPGDGLDNPGFGVGGEIGYLFNENLSFGIGFMYHDVPALNDGFRFDGTNNVQGGEAYQLQGLFRYMPFDAARISPFVELGGAVISGQGTENERDNGSVEDDVFGFGPVVGLGVDIALTPQFSLFLAGQSTFTFPDVALDGADPGAFGVEADDADFDVLATLGGGLKFAFRAPYTAVEIQGLECPAELFTGQTGSFMMMTNPDATQPVTTTWQWGDGTTGAGMSSSHAFSAPGTYTVTAMAMNQGGEDSESCLVTVEDEPIPPTLAGCRATPSTVNAGEQVTVNATATEADEIMVDFGDGTMASTLPARHAYSSTGSYTVTITATNQYGTDVCTIPVTVGDSFCADITELNPVFFGYGAATLTADAMSRLDENIEILRRCPDICVTINAYSDGAEPGDAMRISQRRADAVMQYYVSQGIDADRLRAIGRGVDPDANPKEDPGPGDSRARRADSIPSSCAGF